MRADGSNVRRLTRNLRATCPACPGREADRVPQHLRRPSRQTEVAVMRADGSHVSSDGGAPRVVLKGDPGRRRGLRLRNSVRRHGMRPERHLRRRRDARRRGRRPRRLNEKAQGQHTPPRRALPTRPRRARSSSPTGDLDWMAAERLHVNVAPADAPRSRVREGLHANIGEPVRMLRARQPHSPRHGESAFVVRPGGSSARRARRVPQRRHSLQSHLYAPLTTPSRPRPGPEPPLVSGAYLEPPSVACLASSDVDTVAAS
jgi:hypothetical protein